MSTALHPLVVTEVRHDTTTSVVVTFAQPEAGGWTFTHGQFLTVQATIGGQAVRRCYSLCTTAPNGPLSVGIREIPSGLFSTWANHVLAPGDVVEALPPSGDFTHRLEPEQSREYLLVAGGSGITPIVAIASTILHHEPESAVTLLYVNRTSSNTMLLDEVEALRNLFLGRFRIWYTFTGETSDIELLNGRPDADRLSQLVAAGMLPVNPDHGFVCGPEGLVAVVVEHLDHCGLNGDAIHTELFNAATPARDFSVDTGPTGVVATAAILLNGRTTSVELAANDTILDAMERDRPEVPWSCRRGICATCRAEITDGEVTMAVSHGLSDEELAQGYVLTCQSVPITALVNVDYDA